MSMILRSAVRVLGLFLILNGTALAQTGRFERIGRARVPGPVQGSSPGASSDCRGRDRARSRGEETSGAGDQGCTSGLERTGQPGGPAAPLSVPGLLFRRAARDGGAFAVAGVRIPPDARQGDGTQDRVSPQSLYSRHSHSGSRGRLGRVRSQSQNPQGPAFRAQRSRHGRGPELGLRACEIQGPSGGRLLRHPGLVPGEGIESAAHGAAPRQFRRSPGDQAGLRLLAPAVLPAAAPARGPAAGPVLRGDRGDDGGQLRPILPDDGRRGYSRSEYSRPARLVPASLIFDTIRPGDAVHPPSHRLRRTHGGYADRKGQPRRDRGPRRGVLRRPDGAGAAQLPGLGADACRSGSSRAVAMIKGEAAAVNEELGIVPAEIARAIQQAAQRGRRRRATTTSSRSTSSRPARPPRPT